MFVLFFVSLLVLAALLAYMVAITQNGVPQDSRDLVGLILGVPFAILVFCFGVVGSAWRLVARKPALVVDHQGIWDGISGYFGGTGLLRWEEIAAIYLYNRRGLYPTTPHYRYLGIVPRDLDALLYRQGLLSGLLIKMTSSTMLAPINIPQRILPLTVDDLVEKIHRRYGR